MMNHASLRSWAGGTWSASLVKSMGLVIASSQLVEREDELHPPGDHPIRGPKEQPNEQRDGDHRVGGLQHSILGGPIHPVEFRQQVPGLLLDGCYQRNPPPKG